MFTQIAMRVVELSRYEHLPESKLHSYSSFASSQMTGSHITHEPTKQEKPDQENEQPKPTIPNITLSTGESSKKQGWCCSR